MVVGIGWRVTPGVPHNGSIAYSSEIYIIVAIL